MTAVVFTTCTVVTVLTIVLVLLFGSRMLFLAALSIGLNAWSLVTSERQGFVRSNQLRRAFEPARHFNAAQVLAVVIYIMALVGVVVFALLSP